MQLNIFYKKNFSLSAYIIMLFLLIFISFIFLIQINPLPAQAGAADEVSGYAWSENYGWITFNCTDYLTCQSGGDDNGLVCDGTFTCSGSCVDTCVNFSDYGVNIDSAAEGGTGDLSGYAWSSNLGWISFNRVDTGNPPAAPYNGGSGAIANIDLATGAMSGWAQVLSLGQNGWIKFRDSGPPSFNVDVDTGSGDFSGWAYGAGNGGNTGIGWISFNANTCNNDGDTYDGFPPGCPVGTHFFNYLVTLGGGSAFNSAPTISSVTKNSDPVLVGNNLIFTVNWSDINGDDAKIYICESDAIDPANGCTAGDKTWCEITTATSDHPADCKYPSVPDKPDTYNYYAFACDDFPSCSASAGGTFRINQAPKITLGSLDYNPKPVNEGTNVTFQASWTDIVDLTPVTNDTVTVYFCQTVDFNTTTYCDDPWCDSGLTQISPASCLAPVADNSTTTYFAYVCDKDGVCDTTGDNDIFQVNMQPEISNMTAPNRSGEASCGVGDVLRTVLNWTYKDPGDTLKKYQVKVDSTDGSSSFYSPVCERDLSDASPQANCNTNGCIGIASGGTCSFEIPPVGGLDYGKSYKWTVEVWDSNDLSSGPLNYDADNDEPLSVDDGVRDTFKTFLSEFPNLDIWSWTPYSYSIGEPVLFSSRENAKYYTEATENSCTINTCTWDWSTSDSGAVFTSLWGSSNPGSASSTIITFDSVSGETITLRVTDNNFYSCASTSNMTAKVRLPTWIETN